MPVLFHILTLFPGFFESPLSSSILGRAISQKFIEVQFSDIRRFATDRHRKVDDVPYGGGAGMVMKPEPVVQAIEEAQLPGKKVRRIYFSPQGKLLKQENLKSYLEYDQLILLCGRYEGVDERVIETSIDEEISMGDYVVTGGEYAALVFIDAITRLIPGVVGSEESLLQESLGIDPTSSEKLLEYPHYTRPPEFRGLQVPEVLLSGDHKKIEQWRQDQALQRTKKKRPDLLK